MRFNTLALVFVCCSFALPTMAEETSVSHNSYILLSAGKSNSHGTCSSTIAPDAKCSEKGNVYRLGYGYQFTPTWGMQISYGDFGRAEEDGALAVPPAGVPGGGPIPYTWTWSAVGWEIAATGTLHFGDSFSLIGKLGYLRANVEAEFVVITTTNEIWHSEFHEVSNNTNASIGAQYDFNRDFALRLQHDRYGKLGTTSKIDTRATILNAIFKF